MNRILNGEQLTGHGNREGRKLLLEIMEAGMSAGNPYYNVKKLVRLEGDKLIFDDAAMVLSGDPVGGPAEFDLSSIDRIFVFAIGKGIQYTVKPIEELLEDRIFGGLVISKHGDEPILSRIPVMTGGHPIPDQAVIDACWRMVSMIEEAKLTPRDLVISAMGSGVGSLCTLPEEGISLEDIERYNYLCQIDRGMPTLELTHIRNQIDRLKGGRFTRMMQPARMVNLISGINMGNKTYAEAVTGNTWIHSLPDRTTTEHAILTAKRYEVFDELPESIKNRLLSNDPKGDTLTPKEFEGFGIRVFCTVPKETNALGAAMERAKELGFQAYLLAEQTDCEPKDIGKFMGQIALCCEKNSQPFAPPAAIFTTGELITTVKGETGIGGRNQEYCLAAALAIKGSRRILTAAVDTDGTDGPGGDFDSEATAKGITVLSGGLVDGFTAEEAKGRGVDLFDSIKRHDSSSALWKLDSGIVATQNISMGDLHCTLILAE